MLDEEVLTTTGERDAMILVFSFWQWGLIVLVFEYF